MKLAGLHDWRPQAPTRRHLLLGAGHLAALWALAFVQPLLDLLGRNPEFFVARGNTTGEILLLAFGFTLLPPLVMLGLEWVAARIGARTYRILHFALLTGISLFLFIRVVDLFFSGRSSIVLLLALIAALLLAVAIVRVTFFRNMMDLLIVAPVIVLAIFLFASPVSSLILPGGDKFELAAKSGDDRPVVLIVFDELGTSDLMSGPDRISRNRFPNFARFADTSTWYVNQTTTAYFTPLALPAILTGKRESSDTLPTYRDQPDSLFSQLGQGRDLHVLESVTAICPRHLCPSFEGGNWTSRLRDLVADLRYVEGWLVLPPRMAARLPDISSNFGGFGDNREIENRPQHSKREKGAFLVGGLKKSRGGIYEQFIRGIPASNRGFTMMHLQLPHKPWAFDSFGQEYNQSPIDSLSRGTGRWRTGSSGIATSQARMYVQTGYADRLLGEVRKRLESEGLWDRAIVVVAADHGLSFEGGKVNQRRIGRDSLGEVANPPLLIKYPGQRQGRVSKEPSQTIDIAPTIYRALGIDDHYPTDGVPLQGPVPNRPVEVEGLLDASVTGSLGQVLKQRDQAIVRARQRLGNGPLYRLGPAPQLIGRKVDPVPAGRDLAQLDVPELWEDFRPQRANRLPIFITGTTGYRADRPAGTSPPLLAIAVNGVVRGTGRTFRFENATRFGALVNPASLRRGRNEIGIYAVEGGRLVPLGSN